MDLENRSPDDRFSRAANAILYHNKTSTETIAIPSSPWLQALKGLFGWHKARNWKEVVVKNPNEVFISYSRKDKAFIPDLVSALEKSAFSAWVDWEDIPLTSRWREEIRAGIDGAHTFIFLISGASVTSDECKKEIDYAIAKNKRVIPVVLEDVRIELVHKELRELNWIFFRHTDPYEISKQQLISALNSDLDYNRTHARLLVRATEWETKNKDASYLLHGKDIEAAELWVKDGEQKQPHPTPLHKEYIKASRRSASIRSRNLASIISIMALAAVFAGLKSQANSIRSLIESSEGSLASHLPLEARISSIKAANSFNSPFNKLIGMVDEKLEEQLRLNLTHAVYRDQLHNQIETGGRSVEVLAMSPSGHLIASSSSNDEVVKLWDIHGKPKGSIPCNNCSRVMFSADGQKLVALAKDLHNEPEVVFWDLRSPFTELKNKIKPTGNASDLEMAFSANGKTFVALGKDGVIRAWNLWGDHQQPQSEIHAYTKNQRNDVYVWSIAVSPDSHYIAVARHDGVIDLWDSSRDNNRPILSLDTLSAIAKVNNPSFWGNMFAVDQVRFSPDGSLLAALGDAGSRVLVWSVRGQAELVQDAKGSAYSFDNLVFTPNGEKIGLIQKGKINWMEANRRLKTSTSKSDALIEDYEQPSTIKTLLFSRDQKHLLIGDEKGAINILNSSSSETDNQPMELEHTLSAPDSKWEEYLLSPTGHSLIVWNKKNPGQYCLLSSGGDHACHLLFSAADSKIREWELNNKENLYRKCTLSSGSDQACQLLSSAADSNFRAWAFNSQENLFRITKQQDSYSITPSPPLSLIDSIRYGIMLSKSLPVKLAGCPNLSPSFAISPVRDIASGGHNSFCLWNSKGGLKKQDSLIGDVDQAVYSGNGKVLAVLDRTLDLVSIADSDGEMKAKFSTLVQSSQVAPFARPPSREAPSQVDPAPSQVALNYDGSRIAISTSGTNTVKILGPVGQELALIHLPSDVLGMSFPSDGLRIAIRSPKPTTDSKEIQFLILKLHTLQSLSSQLCKRSKDHFENKGMTDLCKRYWFWS